MGGSPGGDGGPLGVLLNALSNRIVIALLAVVTGSTVGTKLGRQDPFTGTDGQRLEAMIQKLDDRRGDEYLAIITALHSHESLDQHAGAGIRFRYLESEVEALKRNASRPLSAYEEFSSSGE